MRLEIAPFRAEVTEAQIGELRERIVRTRWTDEIGAPWEYGAHAAYLRDLCAYWAGEYDWRGYEARFNAHPHFLTKIDGQRIHFYHVRSKSPDARPLILTHGWPGSVAEFHAAMSPLVDPAAHGGDARDAFHVIAPALPGFGYSGHTSETGWGGKRTAAAFHTLMLELGYDSYFAQGGDKGMLISIVLASAYPEHVKAIHLNLISAPRSIPLTFTAASSKTSVRISKPMRVSQRRVRVISWCSERDRRPWRLP